MKTFEKRFSIDEYTSFLKRFEDLESRLRRLELENDDFRDKVLRKIQTKRPKAEEEQSQPSKKGGIISPGEFKRLKNGSTEQN